MKKQKILSMIILSAFILSMLLDYAFAGGTIGGIGSIPGGGSTGTGGGVSLTPSFRVSLISEEFRKPMDYSDLTKIRPQIIQHYVNHFPNLANSIIFTPESIYTSNSIIAWYQASTGGFQTMDSNKYKHRKLNNQTISDPIFFDALKSNMPNNKLIDLINGKWKNIGNAIDNINDNGEVLRGDKSRKAWNYLLVRWNDPQYKINNLLDIYTKYKDPSNSTKEQRLNNEVGYLDLLMTLYYMSDDTQRKFYYDEIERYIKKDEIDKRPPIIAIDTVTKVSVPAYSTKPVFVPSVDYIMYIAGVTPEYHFTDPKAPAFADNDIQTYTANHTKDVIASLVNKSIAKLPSRSRITNLRGDAYRNNGFSWGQSGVSGHILRTDSGQAAWSNSSVTGVMEALVFNGSHYGFITVSADNVIIPDPLPSGGISLIADTPNPEVLEPGATIIGDMVKVTLKSKLTALEKAQWEKTFLTGFEQNYPIIKINLKATSTGYSQQADAGGTYPLETTEPLKGNNISKNITAAELKAFLLEDKSIDYIHNIMNYEIDFGTEVTFKYDVIVEVDLSSKENPIIFKGLAGSAEKTYINPPKPPEPVYRTYTSEPEFWSEIKQGTPYNEAFDAMAGVPTTRNLYFATGGSEFIVDIVTKYYEDETAIRTYKSHYSGTECEYKQGDIAVMGGQEHSFSETRQQSSGVIPPHGTAPSPPTPAPKTYTKTAASDGKTRTITETVTTNFVVNPPKHGDIPAKYDSEGNQTSPSVPHGLDAPGSYSYSITYTVSAHAICGPCCRHDLPAIEDKWQQTINYDIQKIEQVNIWKIHRSKINGMISLIGTDEVTANIVAGNPTVFSNIATEENSRHGRLRYSLEPTQHDAVEWNEGTRTPHCNKQNETWGDGILYTNPSFSTIENYHKLNSTTKDKATEEFNKFNERRTTDNKATVISDFVILQTSSGDQAVLYFDKDSVIKDSQQNFDKVVNTVEEMWDNNPESAGNWEPNEINLGCYNGKYYNTSTKYEGSGDNHRTDTVLDNDPANTISRPARPSADLRLMNTAIDIINTTPNGEYILGESRVFYTNVLNYKSPTYSNGLSGLYYDAYITYFGAVGLDFGTTYSDNHSKVNDIVVHNPVSAQFAMVLPVDSSRDQRTPSSQLIGGNLQSDIQEYVTRLKEVHPYQNFIYNGDAKELNDAGELVNWKKTGSAVFTAPSQQFRIQTTAATTAGYYTEATAVPNRAYVFSAELTNSGGSGRIVLEELDSKGIVLQTRYFTGVTLNFTTNASTIKFKITIQKYSSAGTLTADNLVLRFTDGSTAEWVPMSYSSYQEATVANPSYVPAHQIPNPAYIPPVDIPGEQADFNYTGNNKTYTIPRDGTYIFEAWGAQGGNYYGGTGGYGTYVKETKTMTAGQTIYVYVGGQGYPGNNAQGGFNGGGIAGDCDCGSSSGGGATDFRYNGTSVSNRFVVAGGGGGVGTPGNNGRSSISIGTSNNVGQTGASSDGGGGGGGYRGGYNGGTDQGAYAGSAYVNGAERTSNYNDNNNFIVTTGQRSGNGFARITAPAVQSPGNGEPQYLNVPEQGSPTITAKVEITKVLSQPPNDWYETVLITIPANPNVTLPGVGSVTAANFLNLDYRFQIYFPNRGDFYGNGAYGISSTTSNRGKGFINNMPTTEYTAQKIVKFDFNVIYNGVLYRAREEINLPVNQEIYDFYLPLANKEAVSASAEFIAIAINGNVLDNTLPTNKIRYTNLDARHSAYKVYNIDIVGRIGNLLIEDTGDFRFSNFFKLPVIPTRWFIDNIVKDVELDQQNNIMGSRTDIRGETVNAATDYLNTYGTLDFMQKAPYAFPLNPDINPIQALRKQPLRIGYPIMMDIQTIGNYYSNMQIIPYYYCLNLQTGAITPVDVYMNVNTIYRPINLFGAAVPGWDPASVYNYQIMLNWEEEAARRNYHVEEQAITEYVRDSTYNADSNGNEIPIGIPMGKYHAYGNAQIMYPNERNRTFIGSSNTYGAEANPGNVLTEYEYNQQGQRWHFTFKLPSSAVFVPTGQQVTQTNIDKVMNDNCVILLAADIKSIGDTYVLQYDHANISINIAGTTHNLNTIPYPVLAIYSSSKSSSNDLTTTGTH